MTTDPFTEAARAEAERRHPAPEIETGAQLGYTQTEIREVVRRTFTNAAEWARTHLAAQEPTDAEVEAACVGFYNDPNGLTDWTKLARVQPDLADKYRAGMRRALSAARAARRDEETTR